VKLHTCFHQVSQFRKWSQLLVKKKPCGPTLNKAEGLKVMATGLDPKPESAKGIRSGMILVLPRSSTLWMAVGPWSIAEGEMMMGLGFVAKVAEAGNGIK
jgi:hypothetical protein